MYGAVSIQLTYLSYDDCLILLLSNRKYDPFAID